MTLNADQLHAADEFLEFLGSDEKEMRLIGPGGVGKSYWVKHIIKTAIREFNDNMQLLGFKGVTRTPVLTALTNKAVGSLYEQTGEPAQTLQSFLKLNLQNDYSTGKKKLVRSKKWTLQSDLIIFIDEAFMMDQSLLNELRASTYNCKIIFIGDDRQLGPVETDHSPICDLDCRTVYLTIPVRNANSPQLKDFCDQLRENVRLVHEGYNPVWPKIPLVQGQIEHLSYDDLQNILDNDLVNPDPRRVILAFTNDRVNDYNNYLRIQRGQSTLLTPGEALIANETFMRGSLKISNESTVVISEADDCIEVLSAGGFSYHTQFVVIKHFEDFGRIPIITDRGQYKTICKQLANNAKKGLGEWSDYFNFKDAFLDLRPRDSCTFHKSQGSTYDEVIIDLDDLGSCNFTEMVARMYYVGVSRARSRVLFVGNLPAKYGGLIL